MGGLVDTTLEQTLAMGACGGKMASTRRITPESAKPTQTRRISLQVYNPTKCILSQFEPSRCTVDIEASSTIFELRQKLLAKLVFATEELPCPLEQSIVNLAEKLQIVFSEQTFGPDREAGMTTVGAVGLRENSEIEVHGICDDLKQLIASEADVHLAARSNNSALLRLIAKYAPGRLSERNKQYSATPLHYGAQHGHMDVVTLLIESSVDINPADAFKQTPLHRAANQGEAEAVAILVASGAAIGATDEDGSTAMRLARRFKHASVVTVLAADIRVGLLECAIPSPEVQVITIKPS